MPGLPDKPVTAAQGMLCATELSIVCVSLYVLTSIICPFVFGLNSRTAALVLWSRMLFQIVSMHTVYHPDE